MKRFLVLLLAMGVLVAVDRSRPVLARGDDKKKEEKKADKDKKDKDTKDKKDDKDKKDKDAKDKDKDTKDKKDKDKDAKDKKDKDKDAKDKKDKDAKDKDKGKKPPVDKPLTEEQKKELEKLSGSFTVTLFERDGTKEPEAELKRMKVTQKGADWTFFLGEDNWKGKDTVFPEKSPREINSLYLNGADAGKTVLGIYKIEGDTITYCWAEAGKERPKEFATKPKSGLTLMTLKRGKAEPETKKDKDKPKDKDKDKEEKDKKDKDKKDKDKKDK